MSTPLPAEGQRLLSDASRQSNWKRWGPYLAERQWGTVREDYSADGNCWDYFPHEHARSRAYRWGEDGLLGICDRECRLCFSFAFWNGRDPILKERLFGLTNTQGNHGEDVKECYYYLESSPTHTWMRGLYKYPQAAFPYDDLIKQNATRSRQQPEYDLADTGLFEQGYYDIQLDYAKANCNDLLIRATITNHGKETQTLHVLPTLWFRNTWSWGLADAEPKPVLQLRYPGVVDARHESLGHFECHFVDVDEQPAQVLFTENESNHPKLFGTAHEHGAFYKDAFHEYLIHSKLDAINPLLVGTKCTALLKVTVPPGETRTVRVRLFAIDEKPREVFGESFDQTMQLCRDECQEYTAHTIPEPLSTQAGEVARQAVAGLLWSKQYYHYVVRDWLNGDPAQPPPPRERDRNARNKDWKWSLFNRDVISMPDKWEYPWYAAWDLAFHMIPMARVDAAFAKEQLLLMLREWYMHPSGQIPAYEFNFSDVNPPVHAWACWRVYKMTGPKGQRDRAFLARAFQKLMLNFTWWVNRKDAAGKNLFGGGFLGLDNIGLFDRSQPLPTGGRLEQADGTAWMAFFCGTMLSMALELASEDPVYEDVASKFFEHFIAIVDAVHRVGKTGLWDDGDGFYYDQIFVDNKAIPLKIRSIVGLIPLFAAEVLEPDVIDKLPGFRKRMMWFIDHRRDLQAYISCMAASESSRTYLLAIPSRERLVRMLRYVLDETEFLSPYGIRSLSRYYKFHPYQFRFDGKVWSINYEPGESETSLFGGNSNWRGPVWFPINFLLIESLERYHHFYGDELKVECPTGSRNFVNLQQVADELRKRLLHIFLPDGRGNRPCHGGDPRYAGDPAWKDLLLFHEFFHAETGRGLGATHQTGWTALVAELVR